MAYDPRMEKLPLFISFPRCGSHWLNSVMELYFDRPRLREGRTTFLPENRKDWMWFHDHDLDLKLDKKGVLYMYRDPVDVMFSDTMSEKGLINDKFIIRRAELYRKHLEKYLLSKHKAGQIIKYERLKENFYEEFKKCCLFFDMYYDKEKVLLSKNKVSKKALIDRSKDKQFIGKNLLSQKYSDQREEFKNQYSERIKKIVIAPELQEYFDV